jgi:hypothetical protein
MNNFIVSGKGFLVLMERNEDHTKSPVWTRVLRQATSYNSRQAIQLIEKNKLDAFIWNPYCEEPIRGMWEVVRRSDYHDFINEEEHNALEWMPRKVMMESKSDARFLISKGKTPPEYYSQEEAVEIAKQRNEVAIAELISKNSKL